MILRKSNVDLVYNKEQMKYISVWQERKVKNVPQSYNIYTEDVKVEGVKIYPNEELLYFYANGHLDLSAFLVTQIAKCNKENKNRPKIQKFDF